MIKWSIKNEKCQKKMRRIEDKGKIYKASKLKIPITVIRTYKDFIKIVWLLNEEKLLS